MANTFLLKIVTPDNEVYNGEIEKISLKSADGGFQILANHADMIASTIPYIAKFTDAKGKDNEIFISLSIVEVKNNKVTISSDAAEFASDIDAERAERAKERAEERLKDLDKYDKERIELSLLRAIERLKLKR